MIIIIEIHIDYTLETDLKKYKLRGFSNIKNYSHFKHTIPLFKHTLTIPSRYQNARTPNLRSKEPEDILPYTIHDR